MRIALLCSRRWGADVFPGDFQSRFKPWDAGESVTHTRTQHTHSLNAAMTSCMRPYCDLFALRMLLLVSVLILLVRSDSGEFACRSYINPFTGRAVCFIVFALSWFSQMHLKIMNSLNGNVSVYTWGKLSRGSQLSNLSQNCMFVLKCLYLKCICYWNCPF